jgi:hypothetical protein
MSARENIRSDDLHALLRQLQASNDSTEIDHYGVTWQELKDKAKKAHAKQVDLVNTKKKTGGTRN